MSSRTKLRSWAEAVAWRQAQPGPVVFTNGVFDLLHPGHVDYLEAARGLGAALVVGVNTDWSVGSLGKGAGRPVVPEGARARVLAGLGCVDCVVHFNDPTPLALIEALRPDVLVKGGDYTRATIVGADQVESWGGRVLTIPLVPGFSTTTLLERLRDPS